MTNNEFIDKYKDIIVTFAHYYKYTFHYKGLTLAGDVITASVGGDASDIYRLDVTNNESFAIGALYPDVIVVRRADGTVVEEMYND